MVVVLHANNRCYVVDPLIIYDQRGTSIIETNGRCKNHVHAYHRGTKEHIYAYIRIYTLICIKNEETLLYNIFKLSIKYK